MSNEHQSSESSKPKESKKKKGLTRREFIAGTVGGVVVGAAVGAAAGSLGFPKTVNQTETLTQTQTSTSTATQLQTTTSTATQTATQTTTATSTLVQAPPAQYVNLTVNGMPTELQVGVDFSPSDTLVTTLRNRLGLTGTKLSCDQGACGACTVEMNGKAVLSCTTLTIEADGKSVTTIEGLRDPATGKLNPIQQAFIDNHAFQCGFCTPGMIMSAKALLDSNKSPTTDQIKQAISGNICRCTGYLPIVNAVQAAAKTLNGGS